MKQWQQDSLLSSVTQSTSTSGYKTLFEKITEKTREKKTFSWYRSAVKSEASSYNKNFKKYILNEKSDDVGAVADQDANELRRYPVQGHLYMFEYKAKMKHLKYYDKFPLVYVIKATKKGEFWGANLHYMTPKKRIMATRKLMEGRIDIPKVCFHKYLQSHVDGLMIDLAITEWDTAILLPTEDFVKNAGQWFHFLLIKKMFGVIPKTLSMTKSEDKDCKRIWNKQSREMAI